MIKSVRSGNLTGMRRLAWVVMVAVGCAPAEGMDEGSGSGSGDPTQSGTESGSGSESSSPTTGSESESESGSGSESGSETDTDPTGNDGTAQDAVDGCLEDIGRDLSCSALGDNTVAFAFDEPVGPAAAVCGGIDLGSPDPTIEFIFTENPEDTSGFLLLGLRLRDPLWGTAVDGMWWELYAPKPIAVVDGTPLPATLDGWTLHVLTDPLGLGFLFQEGESTDVAIAFGAPVTADDVLDGNPLQMNLEFHGGRYLRVDVEAGTRELFDDDTALGVACIHAPASGTVGAEFFGTVACGPDFDSCGDGYQACAVSASELLFTCEPASSCAATCAFSCGAVAEGSCLPPWGPGG